MKVDDRELEEALRENGPQIIRAKWTMDGAGTLEEAAKMLREYAGWLEGLQSLDWQLEAPIEDDYGFIVKAGVALPEGNEEDE